MCAGSLTGASTLYYASDYFDKLYEYAVELIARQGVCLASAKRKSGNTGEPSQSQGRKARTATVPWKKTLICLNGCGKGNFADGEHVLRAKIDNGVAQIGDAGSHLVPHPACEPSPAPAINGSSIPCTTLPCLSDALEGITHSICTLEFENN